MIVETVDSMLNKLRVGEVTASDVVFDGRTTDVDKSVLRRL